VDVMWGTDMTETVTLKDGRARVFVAVDHCSGECVGSHAARSGDRFEALEPVRQGVLLSCTRFPWTGICPTGDRHGEVQHGRE
jgi:hypothetical protein